MDRRSKPLGHAGKGRVASAQIRAVLWLAAIVVWLAIYSFVRVPGAIGRSLWLDEFITWEVAQLPLVSTTVPSVPASTGPANSIMAFVAKDTGMGPAAYLWDGLFASKVTLFGGEFWLRLPGLLAGLAICVLAGMLVRSMGGRSFAVFGAMILAAVYPPFAVASTGSRGYALAQLVVISMIVVSVSCRESRGAPRTLRTIAIALHSVLGSLTHPLAILAPAGLFMGELWLGLHRRHVRPARRWRDVGVASIAVLASAAATAATYRGALGFAAQTATTARDNTARLGIQFTQLLAEINSTAGWVLLVAAVLFGYRLCSTQLSGVARVHRALALGLLAITFLSLIPLVWSFELRLRYFFVGDSAMFCILLTGMTPRRPRKFHTQWDRIAPLLYVPIICAFVWISIRDNRSEHQAWKATVTFLKPQLRETDILITGPHSEHTALIPYAKAEGIPNAVTGSITTDAGALQISDIRAIEALVASGRRVWLVTSFWRNPVRSIEYWNLLERSTEEVARFDGKLPIVVRRSPN